MDLRFLRPHTAAGRGEITMQISRAVRFVLLAVLLQAGALAAACNGDDGDGGGGGGGLYGAAAGHDVEHVRVIDAGAALVLIV
jgi:hypothetical protein